MDRKIKTRQVHKDIKVLDKTVTVTDHIKRIHHKNSYDTACNADFDTPYIFLLYIGQKKPYRYCCYYSSKWKDCKH